VVDKVGAVDRPIIPHFAPMRAWLRRAAVSAHAWQTRQDPVAWQTHPISVRRRRFA
jgi:hypothetical protein